MTMTVRAAAEARILRVAQALPPSIAPADLVFMGGTVLPLLVTVEHRFESPRPTTDVDGVMASASYSMMGTIEQALRSAGFTHVVADPAEQKSIPISRWKTPNAELFDLTFCGNHFGATGSAVDILAIDTAVPMAGHPALRHLSHVGFFVTKAQAFRDRHHRTGKDLADLGVLLTCHTTLEHDVAGHAANVQEVVREQAAALLAFPGIADRLRGTFPGRRPIQPDTAQGLMTEAMGMLAALAR